MREREKQENEPNSNQKLSNSQVCDTQTTDCKSIVQHLSGAHFEYEFFIRMLYL